MPTAFEHSLAAAIKDCEGWCSAEKACALAKIIREERLSRVLEIGVFGGKSLLAIALAQSNAELPDAITVGVDPWRVYDCVEGESNPANVDWWSNVEMLHTVHRKCMEALWSAGVIDRVIVLRNSSVAAASFLATHEWDLIHIDGNHSELSSMRDVQLWFPRLRAGGVLVFDDIDWSSTNKAVQLIEEQTELLFEVNKCRFYRKPGPLTVTSNGSAPSRRTRRKPSLAPVAQ